MLRGNVLTVVYVLQRFIITVSGGYYQCVYSLDVDRAGDILSNQKPGSYLSRAVLEHNTVYLTLAIV